MITFKEGQFEVTCGNYGVTVSTGYTRIPTIPWDAWDAVVSAVEVARAGIDAAADAIIAADDAKAAAAQLEATSDA